MSEAELGVGDPARPGRHSQYGQDTFVGDVLFRGRKGVFVDVGARDGAINSNTMYLEALGWTGLAVEPHPDLFAILAKTRRCRCVNAAASNVEQEAVEFVKYLEQPFGNSGLLSTFPDRSRLAKVKHEIIKVPCAPLSKLLGDIRLVHYLDIDVEGHELEVLQGIDFDAVDFRVIGVECMEATPKMQTYDTFLAEVGFMPFLHLHSDRFYCKGWQPPSTVKLFKQP